MKIYEVDGSIKGTIRGRVLPGCHINEAGHVSFLDWMVYRIEASLRLPCISHIYSVPLFPIGAELSLCRVSSCTHDLPEYEISYLEVSVSDPGVVLSGHAILVYSDPLLRRRPNLVYQVQL